MSDEPGVAAEILHRIDDLANLCVKRFNDDRGYRAAIETLTENLRRAESGPFREYVQPFVASTALVIDRLDGYAGPDPEFAASIRNELLDVLARHGVVQVDTAGPFDPSQHEAAEVTADPTAPAGTVLTVLQRGYAHHGWIFRPARVVVNDVRAAPGPDTPP